MYTLEWFDDQNDFIKHFNSLDKLLNFINDNEISRYKIICRNKWMYGILVNIYERLELE